MKLNFKGNCQEKNPMHTTGNCFTLGALDTFLLTVLGEPKLLVMKYGTAANTNKVWLSRRGPMLEITFL